MVEMPHVDGVDHHYVEVDGLRVHYAEAGSGEPIVLQHGWPQHWDMWRGLIGPPAERLRVICPDLRGHGWTAAPRSRYLKAQLAHDPIGLPHRPGVQRARHLGPHQ